MGGKKRARKRNVAAKGKLVERTLGPAADALGKAIKPVGREIGQLSTIVVRALLRRIAGKIWAYDQIRGWVEDTVGPKVEMIPEEHRVEPSPMIAGPTIEAMRFAGSEAELRELFANLLTTSMDARTAAMAHPSFVEVIKQLTPDEARILRVMADKVDRPVVSVHARLAGQVAYRVATRLQSHIGVEAEVRHEHLTALYLDNLCRLQLCEIPPNVMLQREAYDKLERDPEIVKLKGVIASQGFLADIAYYRIGLTVFGKQFVRACVIPPELQL